MKRIMFFLTLFCMFSAVSSANTVAYWRFEAGPVDTDVVHTGEDGVYYPDIQDVSGNGNHLSVWSSSYQYGYRSEVAYTPVPLTGATNTLSVKNVGGNPAMWCNTLQDWEPAQWTIEVTFKLENGGYRCVVGRDSQGAATQGDDTNGDLSALYFQAIPDNGLAVKFCDVDGYWHDAISATGIFQSFDFGSNPTGAGIPWYSMAAVSDGSFLRLYLYNHDEPESGYQLIAENDMINDNPGSTNTALTTGAGDGGDWDAGDFSVGRGLYGGGHTDRAWGYIDEVRFSDTALAPANFLLGSSPYDPSVIQAADQVNNDVDVTLNWKASRDPNEANGNDVDPDIVDQYIFIGEPESTDPNLYYFGATGADPGNTPASSYGPFNLSFDATYQWVVVEAMDGYEQSLTVDVSKLDDVDPNNVIGPIWWFDSIASVPEITGNPAGVLVDTLGTAEFTVTVDSISTPHYVWYHSLDRANDTPADDTEIVNDSDTLTLTNVDTDDEGFYYSVVSNDSGTDAVSEVAFLEVERLMAWYAFENDPNDSENDYDGTLVDGDPNTPFTYVAGMVNQAISLNGINESVEIPRTIQNSMTIELWVKTTATGGIGTGWYDGDGIVDAEIAGFNHDDFGTSLRGSNFSFGVGNITGAQTTVQSTTAVNDNEWHYCVATRDHETGEITVYIDGQEEASGTAPLGTKDEPEVMRIGSLQTNLNFFEGQIDEVKLYNYPLDEFAVAANYNTVSGESVCITSLKPDDIYNYVDTGDSYCKVDLADFTVFALQWLNCGLYPDCVP